MKVPNLYLSVVTGCPNNRNLLILMFRWPCISV